MERFIADDSSLTEYNPSSNEEKESTESEVSFEHKYIEIMQKQTMKVVKFSSGKGKIP